MAASAGHGIWASPHCLAQNPRKRLPRRGTISRATSLGCRQGVDPRAPDRYKVTWFSAAGFIRACSAQRR